MKDGLLFSPTDNFEPRPGFRAGVFFLAGIAQRSSRSRGLSGTTRTRWGMQTNLVRYEGPDENGTRYANPILSAATCFQKSFCDVRER